MGKPVIIPTEPDEQQLARVEKAAQRFLGLPVQLGAACVIAAAFLWGLSDYIGAAAEAREQYAPLHSAQKRYWTIKADLDAERLELLRKQIHGEPID